jgi:hypothetical protein
MLPCATNGSRHTSELRPSVSGPLGLEGDGRSSGPGPRLKVVSGARDAGAQARNLYAQLLGLLIEAGPPAGERVGGTELPRRRDTLSFQHHAEVAAIAEPEQDLWLTRAQRLRWSRNELRRQPAAVRELSRRDRRGELIVLHIPVQADREQHWIEAARVPISRWSSGSCSRRTRWPMRC